MSANNWTVCPKCKSKATQVADEARKFALDSYGKVDRDTYLARMATSDEMIKQASSMDGNLREDWELGIRGGVFEVSYGAHCSTCGWSKSFKHEEEV